jgi:circadian clock protein KaiC
MNDLKTAPGLTGVEKMPSGIEGLDEITGGGLPRGRTILVSGGPGGGKTLLGVEFLYRGATEFGEPGVLMSFEETAEEIAANVASFGWDLKRLIAEGKLFIDHVQVQRHEIEETGAYDLEALFVRIGSAVDEVGARRIVLDTIESLFSSLPNETLLRSELRRLFHWLKDRGLTAVITGEQGEGTITRYGLEEYVSDCVIVLSNRNVDDVATRRLQVIKYRGSSHGTNQYPFIIDEQGFSILPVTTAGLGYGTSEERVSTGVPSLDEMFGGRGWFRAASVLVSGTAGTGKTSLAANFAAAACARGERCLYIAFEEAPSQITRNMHSIGVELAEHEAAGRLRFFASRPTRTGLETHLLNMFKQTEAFDPHVLVVDPVSNLIAVGSPHEVQMLMTRFVDFLKQRNITSVFTDLTQADSSPEMTEIGISSIMDTWILLRNIESQGERNRGLYILKSRGMPHSNQVREFRISEQGIVLADVRVGPEGVLIGSAKVAAEQREKSEAVLRGQELEARRRLFERRKAALEARMKELEAEMAWEAEDLDAARRAAGLRVSEGEAVRREIERSRSLENPTPEENHGR